MAPRPILKPKCHTCRRRRIQCDYGRPTCLRCKEDGRECEGYDRDLVFVHVQDQVKIPRKRRKPLQAQVQSHRQNQVTAPLNTTPSAASLYGDMMMDEYLDYLAPGRTLYESPSLFWLSGIAEARKRFPPLDLAAKALNIIAIGRSKRVDKALMDALPLYGQAMAGLRNWHVNYKKLQRTCWREALMTSLVFHMFETFDYGPPSAASLGFNNHVEGVTALLHLGGPQILTDPIFRSVFVFARISIWSRGILGGSQTPPMVAWASKTWGPTLQNEPTYLFDILMPLPYFYQEAKRLAKEPHTHDEFAYVKLEMARLTSSLSQWHEEAMDRQRHELFQREDSESPKDSPASPLPALCLSPPSNAEPHGQILFTSSPNGASMMYYWTSQLFMYGSAMEAFKSSPWATDEDLRQTRASDDPEEPTLWDLTNQAAENICNASNFFFNRRSSGLAGIQLTMVPLAAAREFYVKHGESMKPFDEVIDNYIYALEKLLPSAPRAESEATAMHDGSVSKFQQVMSRYGFWFSVPLMPRG